MRALFLLHNHPGKGSWFRALEIARRLARRGHGVEVISTSAWRHYRPTPGAIAAEGAGTVRTTESPCRTLFNERQEGWSLFDNGYRLGRVLTGRPPDLVYAFSHKPCCILPALAARIRGARVVLDWSDWWSGPEGLYADCVVNSDAFRSLAAPIRGWRRATFAADGWLEPRAAGWADAVTLISHEFLKHPAAPAGLAAKSLVLHSGAPLETIRPMDKDAARAALGLAFPRGTVVFGYMANFHTDERLLLEALAGAVRRGVDARLLVLGAGFEQTDPGIHEVLRDRVHHAGFRPFAEVGRWLAAADALVLPLRDVALNRARYPHKLSDYVAAGRPLVACDVGETGRLLGEYGFGSLCRPDPGALADGLAAMAERREEWGALGAATREAAERHFDWDGLAGRLFAFLGESLSLTL